MAPNDPTSPCVQCQVLQAELVEARQARDEALKALAAEREKVNALRLALELPPDAALPGWAPMPDEPPPVRYAVADAANDFLKGRLGSLQRAGRSVLSALARGKR